VKVLAIQHSAGDSPAAAAEIVSRLGHELHTVRIDQGDTLPTVVEADALMMFGGATSLTGQQLQPWVEPERELIRRYVQQGRRVLGICLGAQLLASALGAQVRRNTNPEVGWHLVDRVSGDEQDEQRGVAGTLPARFTALHWHRDTFDIPPGATHLLKSEGCHHQGFVLDDRVFGFQFHLEANRRTVEIFLTVSKLHRQPGRFVQTEQQIRHGMALFLGAQQKILSSFLRQWLS
jgi:GMP synthase-like glutamine amidotransferase